MTPRLHFEPLVLHLRHTFTIARSSEDVARTLVVHIQGEGIDAVGESAPVDRYNETVDLVERQLRQLDLSGADLRNFDDVLARIPPDQRGAMCAVDLALHDWAGKHLGIPAYELLGLDPARALQTSFTIGIDDVNKMVSKAREALHMPILKVKLGGGNEVAVLDALRSVFRGVIRVDANEAWTPEEAVGHLRELKRYDLEFCEQPIPAGNPAGLRYVRENGGVPVMADEDCRTLEDLAALYGCVDAINIKLVKCGGMREAVRMIHAARAMNMKIMLGCMIESSVLCTAAAQLTPLVDYADLDGPLLITDDPYSGALYDGAQLRLPSAPGLGVQARKAA